MKQPLPIVTAILLMLLAVLFDTTLTPRFELLGGGIDAIVIVVVSFGLLSRPAAGALLGFFAGFLYGGIAGVSLAHYIFSLSIVGYLAGVASSWEPTPRTGMLFVAIGTVVFRLILMFTSPQSEIGSLIQATIMSALYNGVLAWPVYALLRRMLRPTII